MTTKPKIVDLFSGCGGFALGAELSGFHTVVAIDVDRTLQSSYKHNFPNTNTVIADLSKVDDAQWNEILKGEEIDGVIGGPPCQGYSRMGVSDPSDPRRQLLTHFFRNINILDPKFFIMENVEGLMDKRNLSELERGLNVLDNKYTVLDPFIIDASEWGAATKRKRVIVIGYDPTRFSPLSLDEVSPPCLSTNVADAISDIGEPIKQNKDMNDFGWAPYKKTSTLSDYAIKMRRQPPKGLGCPTAIRHLNEGKVSGLFDTIHTESVKKRYSDLKQGQTDSVSRSKKLEWEGLCPTLRAGTGSDKGSHQAVRPLHPESGRVITVREAARLQGFPDWFCFHPTKWHSFRMIGNSVSPIVSEAILGKVYSKLAL